MPNPSCPFIHQSGCAPDRCFAISSIESDGYVMVSAWLRFNVDELNGVSNDECARGLRNSLGCLHVQPHELDDSPGRVVTARVTRSLQWLGISDPGHWLE